MHRMGQVISQLARYRREWEELAKASGTLAFPASAVEPEVHVPSPLTESGPFGSNPGSLRMLTYAPPDMEPSPALVVVLHGCTQTAAGYDSGAGWSTLADRYGFVLLFPEQQKTNNPKLCFNWFQQEDTRRGEGEVESIRQMIEQAVKDYGVDRSRIFITGLSAGGAMTAAMLATYPELFSAGAIIAGLPYHCATNVAEAFECMFQGQTRPAGAWGDLVRAASSHRGPWPRISVWHGSADATVKPMNAGEIIKQWTDVHGLPPSPSRNEIVDGYPRRVWTNVAGEDVIEEYIITGMAHGTPLSTNGKDGYGAAGPFLLDAGISSSYHIARFWGLTGKPRGERREKVLNSPVAPSGNDVPATERNPPTKPQAQQERASQKAAGTFDVGSVIARALKAAGLIK